MRFFLLLFIKSFKCYASLLENIDIRITTRNFRDINLFSIGSLSKTCPFDEVHKLKTV
jgi:hypothetical protein